ncbi:hypothetical protein RINTHH_9330 [Richelia intracellularis HH01]|uniref:Uncharacterized protein n=1 Tax=Richelia intracellularis HH01 TaxID=1165094 RepID=M1WZU2_9NOST|nr:hypothetical protein RINTHH_9330 [Richelia intracellularis HH01]
MSKLVATEINNLYIANAIPPDIITPIKQLEGVVGTCVFGS